MAKAISEENALFMLRATLAAHDEERSLWTDENVKYACAILTRANGSVPSLEQVIRHIGEERYNKLLPQIIDKRKFDNALKGYRSPCHYCGGSDDLINFNFALMQVESTQVKVGKTFALTALSFATLPLFGTGLFSLPGRSYLGAALHLRLVVCKPCRKHHSNMFGLFMLNEERASHHPFWVELHNHGFTKFLPEEKMPDEFQILYGQDL